MVESADRAQCGLYTRPTSKCSHTDRLSLVTAPFNNMRTLKFKAQSTNAFSLQSIKCSAAPPIFRLLPSTVSLSELYCAQRFDYRALGSSRKLGGAAEHLAHGSENRIFRLSFEL